MFATVMRDGGLKLIACGALAGAVPYVVQSAYFSIIVSGALLLALLIALYHLWWKVKQTENAEEEKKS
jgi:membrane protein implicated in regulation of membrane protease activity